MREPASQTRRLTLTHGLTHIVKRRSGNGLLLVRESVSLIFKPKRVGRSEIECVCKRVCVPASARACGRACACACERRLKQTHVTHRLTPATTTHVAHRPRPFGPRRVVRPVGDQRANPRSLRPRCDWRGVPEWQAGRPSLTPAIGTSRRCRAVDGRGNANQFRLTFFREKRP